nr:MAG TPA: hypothetical protein [Caudoviricetes sp.]
MFSSIYQHLLAIEDCAFEIHCYLHLISNAKIVKLSSYNSESC